MGRIADQLQLVQAITPVDFQTAQTGDYVSMKNYGHLSIIIHHSIGTDDDDIVISLRQAKNVSDGSGKVLNISELFYKIGATALSAVSLFTRATKTAAATWDTDALDEAQNEALYIIEISKDDLDTDNDFDCVRVAIADTGSNAMLGSALYLLSDPRFDAVDAISD
jgi:hypothetical protein